MDEREDREQAFELRVRPERQLDETQVREQTREGVKDFEQVFAEVVGREAVRQRDQTLLQVRRARAAARGDDEPRRL